MTTLTDAQGQYALESLPRGRYELGFDYVGDEGYASQWWPSSPVPTLEATRFDLGDEELVRDITLPLGASLSGTVRNTDGVGIADVRVTASAYDPIDHGGPVTVNTAQTTADGTYAFEGLPPQSTRSASGVTTSTRRPRWTPAWISRAVTPSRRPTSRCIASRASVGTSNAPDAAIPRRHGSCPWCWSGRMGRIRDAMGARRRYDGGADGEHRSRVLPLRRTAAGVVSDPRPRRRRHDASTERVPGRRGGRRRQRDAGLRIRPSVLRS